MWPKCPKHALIVTSPPENPHRKRKKFFFVSTRRLSEYVEGLNSSLAQSPGELQDCKVLQKKWLARDLKGKSFITKNKRCLHIHEIWRNQLCLMILLMSKKHYRWKWEVWGSKYRKSVVGKLYNNVSQSWRFKKSRELVKQEKVVLGVFRHITAILVLRSHYSLYLAFMERSGRTTNARHERKTSVFWML